MPPNKRSVRFLRNAAKSGNGVKKMGRSRPRRAAGGEEILEVADPLHGGSSDSKVGGRVTSLKSFTDSRAVSSGGSDDEGSGLSDDGSSLEVQETKASKKKGGSAER